MDNNQSPTPSSAQTTPNSYKAGKGMAGKIALTALLVALSIFAIMILCKLNMGETPSVFGYSLDFLF